MPEDPAEEDGPNWIISGSSLGGHDLNIPDTIYHYTDINGLRGIYDGGQLWATSSLFLNDIMELRLGITAAKSFLLGNLIQLRDQQKEWLERNRALDEQRESDSFGAQISELEEIRDAIEAFEDYSQFS
jgi:hypothetical protein